MIDWLKSLTDKDRQAFLSFCKKPSSAIQIYLYSRFLGFKGTLVECVEWSEKKFKKRNFNIVLESEIDAMQQDIAKLREAIDMGMVKQDMGAARIAMLQKELRGSIKQLDDKKVLLDKREKAVTFCANKSSNHKNFNIFNINIKLLYLTY